MAKRKSSAAVKARLKALRKKHGLGEFKNKGSRSVKTRSRSTMAKKRRTSRRSGIAGGLTKPLVAGITYAFVQPFLSQFLSRFNIGIQDELVQIIAAVVLKNTIKNAIVTNWANAAIIINVASLTSGLSSKLLTGGNGSTTTSGNGSVII